MASIITFPPEGRTLHTQENQWILTHPSLWQKAIEEDTILEAPVISCTPEHDLIVSLPGGRQGRIPREECALGIRSGKTREIAILSRVGKPVCFCMLSDSPDAPLLSRARAQQKVLDQAMEAWSPGDIIPATVTHLEKFGAFVDIGCGVTSLIGVETISVSRISHPSERFSPGQSVFAVIAAIDREQQRIRLTHRELLGTWEENAALFHEGETVLGIVRSLEEYGVFIELSPNLSGLAENRFPVSEGQMLSVYIKAIIPEKMKVKLVILDTADATPAIGSLPYVQTQGHMDNWVYSPPSCSGKQIRTDFT